MASARAEAIEGQNEAAIKIAESQSRLKVKQAEAKKISEIAEKVQEAKTLEEAYLAEKEAEYTKLFANPYNAAKYGYIDDVIEPRNTRFRVIRALQQLQTKKLSNPAKKHGNIPL